MERTPAKTIERYLRGFGDHHEMLRAARYLARDPLENPDGLSAEEIADLAFDERERRERRAAKHLETCRELQGIRARMAWSADPEDRE